MRFPVWARVALAAILVAGIAAVGVAANLAVLGSEANETRLGTLSARTLAPGGAPAPAIDPTDGHRAPHTDDGENEDDDD